jgi:hypothetical protein
LQREPQAKQWGDDQTFQIDVSLQKDQEYQAARIIGKDNPQDDAIQPIDTGVTSG